MYKSLSKMSGASFDKAYVIGQIKDHATMIALFKKEQATTTNGSLKSFASGKLPDLMHHAETFQQIKATMMKPMPK